MRSATFRFVPGMLPWLAITLLHAASTAWSQSGTKPEGVPAGVPSEPRPLAAADDPVNQWVEAGTVDGLMLTVNVDGPTITLASAQPARIVRPRKASDVSGDRVTVRGLSSGAEISTLTVADPLVRVVEREGIVRAEQRTLHLALPTPSAVDEIEVHVSVSGAKARFDVRPYYAEICRVLAEHPLCRQRAATTR